MKNSTPHTFVGTTTFTVVGMTNSESGVAVSDAITAVDGVETVSVDVATGSITVTVRKPVDRVDIAQAVEEAGYTALA